MKLKNMKFTAIASVGYETKGIRVFATEKAVSNYANRMYRKYGDELTVTVYEFGTDKIIATYHA